MTTVKLVGRVLQITGDIITADAFDEWLKAVGRDVIQERAKELLLSSLAGQARRSGACARS
jgi:hypothetical protein